MSSRARDALVTAMSGELAVSPGTCKQSLYGYEKEETKIFVCRKRAALSLPPNQFQGRLLLWSHSGSYCLSAACGSECIRGSLPHRLNSRDVVQSKLYE